MKFVNDKDVMIVGENKDVGKFRLRSVGVNQDVKTYYYGISNRRRKIEH